MPPRGTKRGGFRGKAGEAPAKQRQTDVDMDTVSPIEAFKKTKSSLRGTSSMDMMPSMSATTFTSATSSMGFSSKTEMMPSVNEMFSMREALASIETDEQRVISNSTGEPSHSKALMNVPRKQGQINPGINQILSGGLGDSAANQLVIPAEQNVSKIPTHDQLTVFFQKLAEILTSTEGDGQRGSSDSGGEPSLSIPLSNISRIQGQINPGINQILPAGLGDSTANQPVDPAEQSGSNIPTQDQLTVFFEKLAEVLTSNGGDGQRDISKSGGEPSLSKPLSNISRMDL